MGVYLSNPIKEKLSTDNENTWVKCGASSMQGWRVSQEDAHNCCLDFDPGTSLFAVYDGHGGHEVAEYSAIHLPEFIKNTDAYKTKDYEQALKDAFLGFDSTLKSDPVVEELKKIASRNKDNSADNATTEGEEDCDEAADNLERLKEEADMPISAVVAQYTGLNKTPSVKRLTGEHSKPISPFIKAKTSSSSLISSSSSTTSVVSDNEVSSTNDSGVPIVNGLSESNGEVELKDGSGGSGEPSSVEDSLPSSSQNGEVDEKGDVEVGGSGEGSTPVKKGEGRVAKKRASASLVSSLLENSDESDSEDDESFQIAQVAASSDEDENGEEEDDEEGEGEEEEDDDDDDDDDDDEEGDDEDSEEDLEEFEAKDSEEPGRDSGCTAVVAILKEDEVFVANAGDSRAVLCRNGEAVDLSVDHKPEDVPEMERITKAGGRVTDDGRVNGGLNLSRALGDHTYKQVSTLPPTDQMIIALPDVKKEKLDITKDEFIVLACDGIWNSMSSQEVVDFVRPLLLQGEKLSAICEKLFDHCLAPDTLGDGTGCDNMTCVIVQFVNKKQNGESNSKRCASPVEENASKKFKPETEIA